jgi:hypothetical protein
MTGVRETLATGLYKVGHLSLARSASLSDTPLASFTAHISRSGISVIDQSTEKTQQDFDTLDEWLACLKK